MHPPRLYVRVTVRSAQANEARREQFELEKELNRTKQEVVGLRDDLRRTSDTALVLLKEVHRSWVRLGALETQRQQEIESLTVSAPGAPLGPTPLDASVEGQCDGKCSCSDCIKDVYSIVQYCVVVRYECVGLQCTTGSCVTLVGLVQSVENVNPALRGTGGDGADGGAVQEGGRGSGDPVCGGAGESRQGPRGGPGEHALGSRLPSRNLQGTAEYATLV